MGQLHFASTPRSQRDTSADEDESTAKVPLYAQSLARSLVGMGDVALVAPAARPAVITAPVRPRPLIRKIGGAAANDSGEDDEPTERVAAHVCDALEQLAGESACPGVSGAFPIEARAKRESLPQLEMFETDADADLDEEEEEESAPIPAIDPEGLIDADADDRNDARDNATLTRPTAVEDDLAIPMGVPRSPLFPWVASAVISVASIAICAFTLLQAPSAGNVVARAPRVVAHAASHACVGATPVRTLAMSEPRSTAAAEPAAPKPERVAMQHRSVAVQRFAPARAARAASKSGIVRDLPF